MNRKEKLEFLMEDERMRKLEEQNRLLRLKQIVEAPSVAENTIDDDFQTTEVELNERGKDVYNLNIQPQEALVIEQIANDWYPGVQYELFLDEESVLGTIEREIAPTENPTSVSYIVRESVRWTASNLEDEGASEARNLAVVTRGKYVPVEYYDMLVDLYNDTGFFVSPRTNTALTMEGRE